MEKLNNQILKLPPKQLKWFLSFKPLFKISQNYDKKQYQSLIEDIEKKAFKKGYLDVVLMLETI